MNSKNNITIKSVNVNNYAKKITIEVKRAVYIMPFAKLMTKPTRNNPIIEIFVDQELAGEAVTYMLKNGEVDSIPLDAFLDYNRNPDYLKKIFLFEMTNVALNKLKSTQISKNEICKRLRTSPSQLARLLDPTNTKKTMDKMLELLVILGADVQLKCA
mgnify:FL=1|tara:strand:+ start:30403 stop:30876 length:474 start_codon:yes stop_codon:yes gene_type:complete